MNRSSHIAVRRQLSFTVVLCLCAGVTSSAQADRAVLLRADGTAPEELIDRVEESLARAVFAAGHEAIYEQRVAGAAAEAPPSTANEFRAVAEVHRATYVIASAVDELEGGYRLQLRVGYSVEPRMEELNAEVADAVEADRLTALLRVLLRPQGQVDEGAALAALTIAQQTQPAAPPVTDGSDEPAQTDAEREAFLARERERADQAARERRAAWDARERYGDRDPWMVGVGLDIRPILSHEPGRAGGVLSGISAHVGRTLPWVRGLEARGAFDIVGGAAAGFAVSAGGVYLWSPFVDLPVFVGGGADLGYFQQTTGSRSAAFLVRAAPVVVWRASETIYLQAALPELTLLTSNSGVATLGGSARATLRFE